MISGETVQTALWIMAITIGSLFWILAAWVIFKALISFFKPKPTFDVEEATQRIYNKLKGKADMLKALDSQETIDLGEPAGTKAKVPFA